MNYLSLLEVQKTATLSRENGFPHDSVFLYPTDTIYGLGGLVTPQVVEKIKKIKQRAEGKYFSIIAPSFSWIIANYEVANNFEEQWEQYKAEFPGRGLTLILPLKDNPADTIDFSLIGRGVRLIDHPFQEIVKKIGQPFISTSANLSGQPNITNPDQLTTDQEQLIDYCIDAGTIDAASSVIIDYVSKEVIRK